MAKNKPRARHSLPTVAIQADKSTSLAPEPIPDFDAEAFEETCKQFSDAAVLLMKSCSAVLTLAQDTAKYGALRTLAESESVHRVPGVVEELRASLHQCTSRVDEFWKQFGDWRSAERRTRKNRFEKLATLMGWKTAGSWPEPVVGGIVFVTVEEAKDKALVNGHVVTTPTAERVVQLVAKELDALTKGLTESAAFAAQLWTAYRACGASPGEGVSVQDLLAKLTWQRQSKQFHRDPRQGAFREYPLAQFRADLTNYLASGSTPIGDAGTRYELEIAGGSFAQDGMFMYFPQTDRLSTCGRLTFKPCLSGSK